MDLAQYRIKKSKILWAAWLGWPSLFVISLQLRELFQPEIWWDQGWRVVFLLPFLLALFLASWSAASGTWNAVLDQLGSVFVEVSGQDALDRFRKPLVVSRNTGFVLLGVGVALLIGFFGTAETCSYSDSFDAVVCTPSWWLPSMLIEVAVVCLGLFGAYSGKLIKFTRDLYPLLLASSEIKKDPTAEGYRPSFPEVFDFAGNYAEFEQKHERLKTPVYDFCPNCGVENLVLETPYKCDSCDTWVSKPNNSKNADLDM